ncbi:MAG: 6-phosphofructokinase [Treponema sp.]
MKHLGILTSGGDAPGLNAAIRALARTAIHCYGMKVTGIEHGYRGLITPAYQILDESALSGILARGGTILGTSREKPFKNKTAQESVCFDAVGAIKKNYRQLGLDCLAVLGGNGSLTTASLLMQEGLHIIGVPKTIDNDIMHNDMSFGFHTALDIATDAIDRLHSTAASHNRVMIIETMGHKAGWLTLYSGIAGGGDVIIIPEIPYRIEAIAEHIKKRKAAGKKFSIIAVAEGARSFEEKDMDKKTLKKARSKMIGSIGYRIAQELEQSMQIEARVTVLGYVQRGGVPSGYDRILATRFGSAAAEYAGNDHYGILTALHNNEIEPVPLSAVAGKIKHIPKNHRLISTARAIGTCFGD